MGNYYIGNDLEIADMEGSKEDIEKGITCYQQAAEKGDPSAQENLGKCYYYGFLLQKNDEEAAKMFRKAAEQDFEYSQYMLGSMYYVGCGVEKDLAKAEYWFNKAADNVL